MRRAMRYLVRESLSALYILAMLIGALLLISDVPGVKIAGMSSLVVCVLIAVKVRR